MTTISDRVLTDGDLRALSVRSNWPGAIRLAVHLALLLGCGWLVAIADGWVKLPAIVALGIVQAALFAPAHETMHQTAFVSRQANAIVGWLAFLPGLHNAQFYAAYHYAHHRYTNMPGRDPELGAAAPETLWQYVLRVAGLPYWLARYEVMRDGLRGDLSAYPFINARQAPTVVLSVRAGMAVTLLAAIGSALLWGWQAPVLYWILPQLLGQPFLRAYLLAEHTGCSMDRNGLTNTRTTLTNPLVRLLMWDMPFHAEHHLYPSIPFHRLQAAHGLIRERLGFIQNGYARFNAGLVRELAGRGK